MPGVIRVAIPADTSQDALEDYFRPLVEGDHVGRSGLLRPALDLDLDDERALVDEIELESVELGKSVVHISYRIEFSAYHGCKDMDYADEDWREVRGIQDGTDWVFEVHESPEPLAPNEEL